MTKRVALILFSCIVMLLYAIFVQLFPSVYVLEMTNVFSLLLACLLVPLYVPAVRKIVRDDECDPIARKIVGSVYIMISSIIANLWRLTDRMFGGPLFWLRDAVLGAALAFSAIGFLFWFMSIRNLSLNDRNTYVFLIVIMSVGLSLGFVAIFVTHMLGR